MGCRKPCRRRPRPATLFYLDATCPLVSKVHAEARLHHESGLEIVLIGHAGHPEVIGTLGQLPGRRRHAHRDDGRRAPLHARATPSGSPTSRRPPSRSTTPLPSSPSCEAALSRHRRPAARKTSAMPPPTARRRSRRIAGRCDRLIVVGAPNSSNSLRLVEVAERAGCPKALAGAAGRGYSLGPASMASPRSASPPARRPRSCSSTRSSMPSAPASRCRLENVVTSEERIAFNVPRELREAGVES